MPVVGGGGSRDRMAGDEPSRLLISERRWLLRGLPAVPVMVKLVVHRIRCGRGLRF